MVDHSALFHVPYSFKLLLQELQTMNIHMKIITNDNIDHLTSMAYSDNVNKILKDNSNLSNIYDKIRNITKNDMKNIISDPIGQDNIGKPPVVTDNITSENISPSRSNMEKTDSDSIQYQTGQEKDWPESPDYPPNMEPTSPQFPPSSNENSSSAQSVSADDKSINYDDYMVGDNQEAVNNDEIPDMSKFTMSADESSIPQEDKTDTPSKIKDPNVQSQFDLLPLSRKRQVKINESCFYDGK